MANVLFDAIERAGEDHAVRAAILMVNDLAVLTLRGHIAEVLDVDPLSDASMKRWTSELSSIYRDGLLSGPGDTRTTP